MAAVSSRPMTADGLSRTFLSGTMSAADRADRPCRARLDADGQRPASVASMPRVESPAERSDSAGERQRLLQPRTTREQSCQTVDDSQLARSFVNNPHACCRSVEVSAIPAGLLRSGPSASSQHRPLRIARVGVSDGWTGVGPLPGSTDLKAEIATLQAFVLWVLKFLVRSADEIAALPASPQIEVYKFAVRMTNSNKSPYRAEKLFGCSAQDMCPQSSRMTKVDFSTPSAIRWLCRQHQIGSRLSRGIGPEPSLRRSVVLALA